MPHDRQSFTPEDRAVLTETTRLLMMFAASQHSTNELLLLRTAVDADVRLKPPDMGRLNPPGCPIPLQQYTSSTTSPLPQAVMVKRPPERSYRVAVQMRLPEVGLPALMMMIDWPYSVPPGTGNA
jgi:hypothetical protein